MVKCVFSMPLKNLKGLIKFVFKFAQQPLPYLHYSCISRLTKMVNVMFKMKN
ncbi:Mobile element protein [Candidatus Enterovibrio altilux]|uniref:Mobile element protein n=1 Tax=Candidatus Enterovibrio altilux TaxID=1927128 RepID=A0A291BBL0_9GAMM|nr:Mobile element protein [Candidatus Enterovibrio luxaltus]